MLKYLKPYTLRVFLSNRFVYATVVHRPIAIWSLRPTLRKKELRTTLPCTADVEAVKKIGELVAMRALAKNVHVVTFELKKGERYHGKIAALVDTMVMNGAVFAITLMSKIHPQQGW